MEKNIRKIDKMGEISWLLGTILVALGVCLCKKADLGVSMIAAPAFIIFEVIGKFWNGFSIGMVEYMIQGLLLIVLMLTVRKVKFRYFLCFLVAILYGYTLDLWMLIFGSDPFSSIVIRWIMFFVGDILTAIGVAFFFRTYMPLQVYELFVSEVADKYIFPVNKTKFVYDIVSFVVSVVLAFTLFGDAKSFNTKMIFQGSFHSIGIGTIITSFINAPIIAYSGKLMDKIFGYEPLLPKLKTFLIGKN